MSRKYLYDKDLHVASILSKNDWSNVNVHALLQSPGDKQPSINAYLGARYSRSADSVWDIAAEVMEKGVNSAERLEAIFHGYGHKSVGDMADLFLCIENIPMITAMRIFNINPVIAGQERSTRYQNFQDPRYVKIPKSLKVSNTLRKGYDDIIHKHLEDYCEMLEPTKMAMVEKFKIDISDKNEKRVLEARTFDVVRYFLPIGLETSFGVVMSARNWAELIGYFRASNQLIDNEIAELIYDLLTGVPELTDKGYVPEADGLIRHTEANDCRLCCACELKELLAGRIGNRLKPPSRVGEYLVVEDGCDPVATMLSNVALLNDPYSVFSRDHSQALRELAGKIVFDHHDHYKQIGCVGQSGAIMLDSFADQGILKDLNRHRSMERFVPLWNESVEMDKELDRESSEMFFLCDYLYEQDLAGLRKQFAEKLTETYDMISEWYEKAKNEMADENVREFTRYLLPHAHSTRYRFFGSVDDLQYTINLRTRNGGHIAYRKHTYQWLEKLAGKETFWQAMLDKLPPVEPSSRDQLMDRS